MLTYQPTTDKINRMLQKPPRYLSDLKLNLNSTEGSHKTTSPRCLNTSSPSPPFPSGSSCSGYILSFTAEGPLLAGLCCFSSAGNAVIKHRCCFGCESGQWQCAVTAHAREAGWAEAPRGCSWGASCVRQLRIFLVHLPSMEEENSRGLLDLLQWKGVGHGVAPISLTSLAVLVQGRCM